LGTGKKSEKIFFYSAIDCRPGSILSWQKQHVLTESPKGPQKEQAKAKPGSVSQKG
jgi:hypothetical protein